MLKFDKNNPNWDENSSFSRIFLKTQESYLNDVLRARGHVLLNDVYDQLGFPRTGEGMTMGWTTEKCTHINFDFYECEDGTFDLKINPYTDVQADLINA